MWNLSNCEIQGRGHVQKKVPCQDKTKATFKDGTYIIALSDGAGSAKLSHFGAECVVETISDFFVDRFDPLYDEMDGRLVKVAIIENILAKIDSLASEMNCMPKDLAATMLVVAVKDDRFIIAHIGDGVIGYLDGDTLKVASAPCNGEHANETFFVTSRDAINTMNLFKGKVNNIAGFVLMSDGTEQSLYNKKNNTLSNAVVKLMQRNLLLEKSEMNAQLQITFENIVITRTQDDCSIALMSRENNILHPMYKLTFAEKCDLYDVNYKGKTAKKRVERYDEILNLIKKPMTCEALSRKIHLEAKYTRRHLEHLHSIGLLKKTNNYYHQARSGL